MKMKFSLKFLQPFHKGRNLSASSEVINLQLVYPVLPAFAKPAWNHSAGPKTVFFWAPTIKWCLVGAGLADLARPAEKLSISQVKIFCNFHIFAIQNVEKTSFIVSFTRDFQGPYLGTLFRTIV